MSLYAYSVSQLKNKVIIIKNGCKVTNYFLIMQEVNRKLGVSLPANIRVCVVSLVGLVGLHNHL